MQHLKLSVSVSKSGLPLSTGSDHVDFMDRLAALLCLDPDVNEVVIEQTCGSVVNRAARPIAHCAREGA